MKKLCNLLASSVVLAALVTVQTLHACPSCSEAVAANGSTGLGAGLNYTTIGMIALPFLVVGVAALAIFRLLREADRPVVPDTITNYEPSTPFIGSVRQ